MRIGIITQPLSSNYGAILQNYALQTILKRLGHEVFTVDYCCPSWIQWFNNVWRVLIHKMLGHIASYSKTPTEKKRIEQTFRCFVEQHISLTTPRTRSIEKKVIKNYYFNALVVGSDQIWRPCYNSNISQCFLSFAEDMNVKRIAYAASFGTDKWEYTSEQTTECAVLAKRFDSISVREYTGIKLCRDFLGVEAMHVLDPTLLLTSSDYCSLCAGIPKRRPFVFAYILDKNEEKQKVIECFAERMGLPYIVMSAGPEVHEGDSVERWLSYFRDAYYVITDSFHGAAFCIDFHKEFFVYTNDHRGNSRFDSLLELFDLKNRIIEKDIAKMHQIDWEKVEQTLAEERCKSLSFIKLSVGG